MDEKRSFPRNLPMQTHVPAQQSGDIHEACGRRDHDSNARVGAVGEQQDPVRHRDNSANRTTYSSKTVTVKQ